MAGDMQELMVEVALPPRDLKAFFSVPPSPRGVVLFAHGSGSGRHSPRNQHVARALQRAGLATLLLDLLDLHEEIDRANVFDIGLLAQRLTEATGWVKARPQTKSLPVGYFGASTGAGAALVAAAQLQQGVSAVVSRGGRPDLAGDALERVIAPTLLIVGSLDSQVIELNQQAMLRMHCEKSLAIVPGASHLFVEPGTLDDVVRLASAWFLRHLDGEGADPSRR